MGCCSCVITSMIGTIAGEKPYNAIPEGAIATQARQINCGVAFDDGRDEPMAWMLDISTAVGMMTFSYESYSKPDRFRLYMDRRMFWDSGCVGTRGWQSHTFYVPKSAKRLWIETIPNCTGGTGTAWRINTSCPNGERAVNDRQILREYRYGSPYDIDQSVFIPIWDE